MRVSHLFVLLALLTSWGFTQELTVQNPSFENNLPDIQVCIDENGQVDPTATQWNCPWPGNWEMRPRSAGDPGIFGMTTIDPWNQCAGTVDLLPNAPGLNVNKPASHGDWYFGLVCDNRNFPASEAFSQELSAPFQPGVTYTFDIDLATNGSPYQSNNLAQPGRVYLIGRMAANSCGAPASTGDQQILWDSGPVTNSDWETFDISFIPTKAWTHIYITMSDQNTCKTNSSNVLIDKIGSFFPGGLKITSPSASSNMPCSQLIEGIADEVLSEVTVSGTFDGGTQTAQVIGSGKNWELQVSYSNQTARSEILKVVANYVDPTILPDTIEVPVNIAGPLTDFGTSIVDVNSPVGFTDLSPDYDAGNTIEYLWDFGDGNTSTQESPNHTYSVDGTYDVTQTITYNGGQCSDVVQKTIIVPKEPGVINITSPTESQNLNTCSVIMTGTTNYRPDQLIVKGSPSGNVIATMTSDTTWEAELFFSGSSAGAQSISAEATFPANVATQTRNFDLTVSGDLVASFTSQPSIAGDLYGEYTFTNTTTGTEPIGQYIWSYNSEGTDSSENSVWRFNNFGDQIVRFQAIPADPNACGGIALDTLNIPIPGLSDDGNFFNDVNEDGTLDQVQLQFETRLDSAMIANIGIKFNWYNDEDSLISITSDEFSWELDPNDPTGQTIIWNLPDSLNLQKLSTDVKVDYGTPQLRFNVNDSLGLTTVQTQDLVLGDGMAPLVVSANLTQNTGSAPDLLIVNFSEELDITQMDANDLFTFRLAKNNFARDTTVSHQDLTSTNWRNGNKSVFLYIGANSKGVFPNDSLKAISAIGKVVDMSGNIALATAPMVKIDGKIAQTEDFNVKVVVGYDDASTEETDAIDDPVIVERGTNIATISNGDLGTLFSLVIPTRIEKDGNGNDIEVALEPEEIEWDWQMIYYDNLGTFVTEKSGTIKCTDPVFQANGATDCTTSNLGMAWIKWNYRDQYNRKVGTGAYIQNMILNGEAFEPHVVGVTRID